MPSGIINLLSTSNSPSVNADRLYNLNNTLYFAGSKVLTASNINAGNGIIVNESNGTLTLSTNVSPYTIPGPFFELPVFAINSPTTSYQTMNIHSSAYSTSYITYIIPKILQ